MRTLDELTAEAPGDAQRLKQISQAADALMAVPEQGPVWQGLRARFELAIAEANDAVTHPDTPEEKRAGWAGRERGLRDLWSELADLRSGKWKEWPEVSASEERQRKMKARTEEEE